MSTTSSRAGQGRIFFAVLLGGAALALSGCPGPEPGPDSGTDAAGTPQCFDGVDNDGDALTDFPNDPGCLEPQDDDESEPPQCDDGLDNDADGVVDLADPGCTSATDTDETNPQCSDQVDNDGDGNIDYPADSDCFGITDDREAGDPQCSDGVDNDQDTLTDFPDDTGCTDADDPSESDLPDCNGVPVVNLTYTGSAAGVSTSTDLSASVGACGGDGSEAIGFLDVPVPLSLLSINAFGTSFDTALYVREACEDPLTELDCSVAPFNTLLEIPNVPAGPLYVFHDGDTTTDFGNWYLRVFGVISPGQACVVGDPVFRCDSVSGQICSEVLPGAGAVCNAGQCSDGVDNDADLITDYPLDPGCDEPADNDEAPDPIILRQCYNGIDDDADAFTDYPADPGCMATSDNLEIDDCAPGIPLEELPPDGHLVGVTTGTSNMNGSCNVSFTPPDGAEDIIAFELEYTAAVTIRTSLPGTTMDTYIYVRTDCDNGATEIGCNDNDAGVPFSYGGSRLDFPSMAPGTYFIFVDGVYSGTSGAYELQVSGRFAAGAPCDPSSTVFTCDSGAGDLCQDDGLGVYRCLPADCADGTDNDGDSIIDYPYEPGCGAANDDTEADPPTAPVCVNGVDDDGDSYTDFPADIGCFFAADTDEMDECIIGVPFLSLPSDGHYFGSIVSATGSFDGTCTVMFGPSSGEGIFVVNVPATASVLMTTNLSGTTMDTAVYLRTVCADAGTEVACNDSSPTGGLGGEISTTLSAGYYFLFVDGVWGSVGSYELRVSGTFASGAACDPTSTIFTCDLALGESCQDGGGGSYFCLPADCSDGVDNDGDLISDFPAEPGCVAAADNDETNPVVPALCSDLTDNDGDALIDFPGDLGCTYAADMTEVNICGASINPVADLPGTGSITTSTGPTNNYDGGCGSCSPSAGEIIYVMYLAGTGTLTASTNNSLTYFDTMLYLRTTCSSLASQVTCNDNDTSFYYSTFSVPITTPGQHFLFVDGNCGSWGQFHLDVDYVVDGGEPCDPGVVWQSCEAGFACIDGGGGIFSCL